MYHYNQWPKTFVKIRLHDIQLLVIFSIFQYFVLYVCSYSSVRRKCNMQILHSQQSSKRHTIFDPQSVAQTNNHPFLIVELQRVAKDQPLFFDSGCNPKCTKRVLLFNFLTFGLANWWNLFELSLKTALLIQSDVFLFMIFEIWFLKNKPRL